MFSRPHTPANGTRPQTSAGNTSQQATNRDKYENKPMPKLPVDQSPSPKAKGMYLQPAVPLANKFPPHQKHRAVTEPIPERRQPNNMQPNISSLRRKFSKVALPAANSSDHPTPSEVPSKAQEVLGINAARASGQALGNFSKATKGGSEGSGDSDSRHSTTDNSQRDLTIGGDEEWKTTKSDERTAAPKMAQYASVGKIASLQPGPLHSSGSFQGIIESAADTDDDKDAESHKQPSLLKLPRPNTEDQLEETLQPCVYSPSVYNGVWERNPAVGISLPPWTPLRAGTSRRESKATGSGQNIDENDAEPQPVTATHSKSLSNTGPQPCLPPPSVTSANSWATHSKSRSLNSAANSLSVDFPLRWPSHLTTNSVPSPPAGQSDYPRPSPVSASLAHLDMTLHHHLDVSFEALSRLVVEKHDRVLDGVLTRMDNLEDVMRKGFKDVRSELKLVKGELSRVKGGELRREQDSGSIANHLGQIEAKLALLETHVKEGSRHQPSNGFHFGSEMGPTFNGEAQLHMRRSDVPYDAGAVADSSPLQLPPRPRTASNAGQADRRAPGPSSSSSPNISKSQLAPGQPTFNYDSEMTARKAFFAELAVGRGMSDGWSRQQASSRGGQDSSQSESEPSKLSDGSSNGNGRHHGVGRKTTGVGVGGWYHQAYVA